MHVSVDATATTGVWAARSTSVSRPATSVDATTGTISAP